MFEIFKGTGGKPESEKSKEEIGKVLEKEEFTKLKETVQVPKEKEEFERLAKMTESYLTKGEEKEQMMRMMKISAEDKDVFAKLADMIGQRVVVTRERPRELSEEQRAEIREIFAKLGEIKSSHGRMTPELKEITVKKKPKEEVFAALEKLAPKKKPTKKPFKKLKKMSKGGSKR